MVIRNDKAFAFFSLALLLDVREVERDGLVDEFHVGVSLVDADGVVRERVRLINDVLATSVRAMMDFPEVSEWVKALGGIRKLDEHLVGRRALRQHIRDLREIKSIDGFAPVLSDRVHIEGIDSATAYDSYAVQTHREVFNKKAYGEIDDEENSPSSPSWEGHESNIGSQWVGGVQKVIKPFWWNKIYMGRFRVGRRSDGKKLVQVPHSTGKDWLPDIRFGKEPFTVPFQHITARGPWWQIEENPIVKDFIDRFYNNPTSLRWGKTGTGKAQRWACAMEGRNGHWLWSPVSVESSKSIDWWNANEGKMDDRERWYSRALYHGPWIIAYQKSDIRLIEMVRIYHEDGSKTEMERSFLSRLIQKGGTFTWEPFTKSVKENCMKVRALKSCDQTGWLAIWKTSYMTWSQWGAEKKRLIKLGAKDAYFGKPWKAAEYQQRVDENSPI